MGSLMENEPWPIGFCPCPNGRYTVSTRRCIVQVNVTCNFTKYIFFLSSDLRIAMILIYSFIFYFKRKKIPGLFSGNLVSDHV